MHITLSSRLGPQCVVLPTPPDAQRVNPIRNNVALNKPYGGFWTAPHTPHATSPSPWVQLCINHGWEQQIWRSALYVVYPRCARIAVIHSRSDIHALQCAFPHPSAWNGTALLDWEQMACTGLAGLHVTANAASFMEGWDIPSTIWFGWHFATVRAA